MDIELVPCSVDRAMFLALVKDYLDILHGYDESIEYDEHEASKWIWDARFIVADGILCGFVITQEIRFKKAKNLLYIAEMYVEKEEGRQKVGLGAVREAVKGWDGDVFLYILKENNPAKEFWGAVERELGWRRIERGDIKREAGCELRVYQIDGRGNQ